MDKIYYYINNQFIDSESAMISFHDAGFLYGDGLFETMRFDNRQIFSPQKHIHRLQKGLNIIGLHINKNSDDLLFILNKVIKKNNFQSGIIRLMITRGNMEKMNSSQESSLYISIKPFYDIPSNPVKVLYMKEDNFPIIRFSPAIKSMNYLGNMLAKKDADKKGAFEPVFYNKDGFITECAIRNIFYIKDNIVLTPNLNLGILSGVMRETVIEVVHDMGLECKESYIKFSEIESMHESFITSTGIGLLPCYWEQWSSDFLITKQIKKELFKRIKNN